MANKEMGELPAAGPLDGTEQTHVVQGAHSRRLTISAIGDYLASIFTAFFAPRLLAVEAVAATAYTLALADVMKHKRFTAAGAVTLTIPANAAVALPIGTRVRFTAAGAGGVTIAPGAGVTLNSRGGALTSGGQFAVFEVEKVAANEWDCLGDLS